MDIAQIRKRTLAYWEKLFTWRRVIALAALLLEEASIGLLWKGLAIAARWIVALAKLPMGLALALIAVFAAIGTLWVAVDPMGIWERRRARLRNSAPQPIPLSSDEKE